MEESEKQETLTEIAECKSEEVTTEQDETTPLMFTRLLENKDVAENETVDFYCEMTQSGVDVIWLRNGQQLSLSEDRCQIINQDLSYHLVIPNVTGKDRGEYTVKVGDLQSTAELTVHGLYCWN